MLELLITNSGNNRTNLMPPLTGKYRLGTCNNIFYGNLLKHTPFHSHEKITALINSRAFAVESNQGRYIWGIARINKGKNLPITQIFTLIYVIITLQFYKFVFTDKILRSGINYPHQISSRHQVADVTLPLRL